MRRREEPDPSRWETSLSLARRTHYCNRGGVRGPGMRQHARRRRYGARADHERRARSLVPPTYRDLSVYVPATGPWEGTFEMTVLHIAHPSLDERAEHGRQAREHAPLDSHSGWRPAADRPDPVAVLDEQNRTREPDLVPVRHGRMMASPFTFYRGAAAVMAADLKDTPTAGLDAQLCGDAHLSNFGAYASPERRLLFDLNDFDETLPGPVEYDVKRMAASFTIAARNNGFSKSDTRDITMAAVTAYREAMATFGQMGTLDVWYAHLDEDQIMASLRDTVAAAGHHEKAAKKGAKGKAEKGKAGKDGKADRVLDKAAKNAEKT